MFKQFLLGVPFLAVALTVMPHAQAGQAATEGARRDDTVMSSSGGAAWVDCDARNQRNNAQCAKKEQNRQRAQGSDAPSRNAAGSSASADVPMAGPEGKGVPRSGS